MRPKLEFVPPSARALKQGKVGIVKNLENDIAESLKQFLEHDFSLDEFINLSNPGVYLIKNSGHAMSPRVFHGDLLVVNRGIAPIHEDIVIVVLNGQFLVRRFFKHKNSQGGEHVELVADNQKYRSMVIAPHLPFEVWGVVTHVLGALKIK